MTVCVAQTEVERMPSGAELELEPVFGLVAVSVVADSRGRLVSRVQEHLAGLGLDEIQRI